MFYLFLSLAVYGLFTAHPGAALLAAFSAFFFRHCKRVMHKQEQAWLNDPVNATKPPDTQVLLDRAGVECSGPDHRA
jgi:hypothetical protein